MNGKEVEFSAKEDLLDSDDDAKTPNISLATIICTR
jgi:hypothetical protein